MERKKRAAQPVAFSLKTDGKRQRRSPASAVTGREAVPFSAFDDPDDEQNGNSFLDDPTYSLARAGSAPLLVDPATQFRKLTKEGSTLAEAGRYADALSRWSQALSLVDSLSKSLQTALKFNVPLETSYLREMRAQTFMARREWFRAVKEAEEVVKVLPEWVVGWQTLGRAQMGFGEPALAVTSFQRVLDQESGKEDELETIREVREEDMPFAKRMVEKLKEEGLLHARVEEAE
ncbi:uncharacterized protein EV422DRAFT_22340 [Fimicolochytrium jonesii]|uniref:uncharacterized protein n=1 Tax=Fimicolochytrium jonesii TaxID=1396493 RepID=UPI0022FE690C|nr:uncharacterized protein EV422DRAFT_22340 [Fimicolochytrium jonesii]KAI8827020.1 hypothetical protein EV422DRAFT_22340 [Fimicolochytrium jonesii]